MKTKKSLINALSSVLVNIISILVGLVAQSFFIKMLNTEYLGINGLFSNIISMLGIVELGIGNAIIYNLYKPLAINDKETIKSLMNFYKKTYNFIAIIVLIIGLFLIPFLPFIIGKTSVHINLTFVYILFVFDIVCSYLLSYKRSILYADQKNYVVNIIHVLYYVILNLTQIYILFLTQNYYLYLIVKIIMRLLENIIITIYVNKKYKFLNTKKTKKIEKKIFDDIIKKVKALFFHKIGSFVVMGTDNIIISKFLGVIVVGLYSNYYMIIDATNKVFGQALSSLIPSVGHLLIENDEDKIYNTFKKIRFINFWIATFVSTSIFIVMQSFVKIWLGDDYLLPNLVLMILCINFYQNLSRNSYNNFKEAAGIYYEDRFVPIFESIINIVTSVILVKLIGLPGVFIGTFISGLTLWCYSYPKFVYKKIFNKSYFNYTKETLGYFLLFIIIFLITKFISVQFVFDNNYADFFCNLVIAVIVPNITILILFFKSDNFKYFINLLKKMKGNFK